jgi:hypothetical protein
VRTPSLRSVLRSSDVLNEHREPRGEWRELRRKGHELRSDGRDNTANAATTPLELRASARGQASSRTVSVWLRTGFIETPMHGRIWMRRHAGARDGLARFRAPVAYASSSELAYSSRFMM